MNISERQLRKWRGEALCERAKFGPYKDTIAVQNIEKILEMTQELLDQHLLNKELNKERREEKNEII